MQMRGMRGPKHHLGLSACLHGTQAMSATAVQAVAAVYLP